MNAPRFLPVKEKRLFNADTYYKDIDWNDWDVVLSMFKERIETWYINPIDFLDKHCPANGFPIVGLSCLLVDTLSQYYFGIEESKRSKFIEFARTKLPSFKASLPTKIYHPRNNGTTREITNYAEVLYYAFRCGILHEAHVSLYGGIAAQDNTVEFIPSGITMYGDGTDCPTIIIDPNKLFSEVKSAFYLYIDDLGNRDSQYDPLREKFKKKFFWSFGINIGNE